MLGIGLSSLSSAKDIFVDELYVENKSFVSSTAPSYYLTQGDDLTKFFGEVSDATLYLENGTYPIPSEFGYDIGNEYNPNKIAVKSLKRMELLTMDLDVGVGYDYVTGVVFQSRFNLNEGSSLDGIIFDGSISETNPYIRLNGKSNVINCIVKNSNARAIYIDREADGSKIMNNIFNNTRFGVQFSSSGAEEQFKYNVDVSNNLILDNEIGVRCSNYINLGADNVLRNNINVWSYSILPVIAENQYWYDWLGFQLTTEEDILATCFTRDLKVAGSSLLDVVPFHTDDYFNPPTPTPTPTPTYTLIPTETNTPIYTPTHSPTLTPTNETEFNHADLNKDGNINQDDLFLFMQEWRNVRE